MPIPDPNPHATSSIGANDGTKAAPASAPDPRMSPSAAGPRLPRLAATHPANGNESRHGRHGEDDDAEAAAVERQLVLQRRQSCDPDAVDRTEHDEAGDECPMCASSYAGTRYQTFTPCFRYAKDRYLVPENDSTCSTTPAIAWPKPMHMAAIP